jgi:hypothetical protein
LVTADFLGSPFFVALDMLTNELPVVDFFGVFSFLKEEVWGAFAGLCFPGFACFNGLCTTGPVPLDAVPFLALFVFVGLGVSFVVISPVGLFFFGDTLLIGSSHEK